MVPYVKSLKKCLKNKYWVNPHQISLVPRIINSGHKPQKVI